MGEGGSRDGQEAELEVCMFELCKSLYWDALIPNKFLKAKTGFPANNVSHSCLNKARTIHSELATAHYFRGFGGESYDKGQRQILHHETPSAFQKKTLLALYLVSFKQWKPTLLC